ncbi:MAG: hypothetical protein LBH66_06630 [Oscillospiraceae bacterium]|nr:hypothetical protein [Oscillospiraceae bacterium]
MDDPRCALYVSSCDKYSDLWRPFFDLLVKYWPDRPYEITLGSESEPFDMEGLSVRCPRWFKSGANVPWGLLTMGMLDSIDADYVLFMLDDFFLSRPVDQEMVSRCVDWLDADKDAGGFILRPITARLYEQSRYPPFMTLVNTGRYSEFTQAAVWRKSVLRGLLLPYDNPWQWEEESGARARERNARVYYIDSRETDYAAVYYPPGGVLRKGTLTGEGARALEENGMLDALNNRERGI